MLHRIQVQLSTAQRAALRRQSAREGVSIAELVRRAVDGFIASEGASSNEVLRCRASEAAGRFRSGHHDTSARHDEVLADAYRS